MEFSKLNIPNGLNIRPSRPSDKIFLENLYKSTRDDLRQADNNQEYIESILDMQVNAQRQGYGSQFTNAMYFIIEKHEERIGNTTLDFGPNEICLVDIALIPSARGKGFGESVIRSFMHCAEQVMTPFTLCVLEQNIGARRLYHRLGFQVESVEVPYIKMVWYPSRSVAV